MTCAEDIVPLSTIHRIAYSNARALWGGTTSGDVYGTESIPYYALDDEVIAYMFNFSIGQPFTFDNWYVFTPALPSGRDFHKKRRVQHDILGCHLCYCRPGL
ncbi:MAG: hypothetical protein QMD71_09265 [bacterium]|nr:hypothetical protein [bacterium]